MNVLDPHEDVLPAEEEEDSYPLLPPQQPTPSHQLSTTKAIARVEPHTKKRKSKEPDDWEHPADDPVLDDPFERSLPNSSESERAILGAILLDNAIICQAVEYLIPDDFYVPSHRRIFEVMCALFERGSEINPILIGEELKKTNNLQSVGGISFITNLAYGLPHSTNILHYAKVVKGKALLRRIVKASNKTTQDALAEEDEPEVVLDRAEHAFFNLHETKLEERTAPVGEIIENVMTLARENSGHGVLVTGITTGLIDLDALLGGLQKQHFIIIAARPSMGKSALATCLAEYIGVGTDNVVLVFTLEMSKEELGARMVCSRARVNAKRLREGILSKEDWASLGKSAEAFRGTKIVIDDEFATSVMGMRAKARRTRTKYGRLDLIIIDYLQLMEGAQGGRNDSREREVARISRALKGLAKDLDIPVIALSQLNRQPEGRPNKRPQLSDLRESGTLEQDTDVVIFIYREAYYQEQLQQEVTNPFEAELIVAKARSGGTGVAHVRFEKVITRFENLVKDN